MTDTGDNTQPAMTYPQEQQYERWKDRAGEMDMSVSEWMQAMIEAGMKADQGFEIEIERDETHQELREQRNDLKQELEHARNRIEDLEHQLYRGEQSAILEFVEENPGTAFSDIVQHIIDTVPQRVNAHLENLEGEKLVHRQSGYYLADKERENA